MYSWWIVPLQLRFSQDWTVESLAPGEKKYVTALKGHLEATWVHKHLRGSRPIYTNAPCWNVHNYIFYLLFIWSYVIVSVVINTQSKSLHACFGHVSFIIFYFLWLMSLQLFCIVNLTWAKSTKKDVPLPLFHFSVLQVWIFHCSCDTTLIRHWWDTAGWSRET